MIESRARMQQKVKTFIPIIILALFLAIIVIMVPDVAFADNASNNDNGIHLSSAIEALKGIITTLLLPVAIILCAWRILYIAIVCGIMGMDPLGFVFDEGSNGLSAQEVKQALLMNMTSFLKGLCWVGGIWLIFQIALTLASWLAVTFTSAFS